MKLPHHVVWPGLVIVILGASLTGGIITITIASSDPSFAIKPDYYEKALAWDERHAAKRDSDALGWRADITLTGAPNASGERRVTLRLEDDAGQAIDDAGVTCELFHKARSADRITLTLELGPDGTYQAWLPSPREGAWHVGIIATRAADTFVTDKQLWVFPSP